MSNGEGVQSGVRYAILLKDSAGNTVSEYVYPGDIHLSDNEKKQIELIYEAPSHLSGSYTMYVRSVNISGLPLALVKLGEVNLTGSGEVLQVDIDSCFLTIEGDSLEEKYTLAQGVDVSAEEKLLVSCSVTNLTSNTVGFEPSFATYERNIYGKSVEHVGSDTKYYSVLAGEEKLLTFIVPIAQLPQSYDTLLTLGEENGSRKIQIHYVLQGASATVQNIIMDKEHYSEGDVASLTLVWSPATDTFPDSRSGGGTDVGTLFAFVSMADDEGNICGEEEKVELLDRAYVKKFSYSVKTDCPDPVVTAELKDVSGIVLTNTSYTVDSDNEYSNSNVVKKDVLATSTPVVEKEQGNNELLFAILGLVGIALLGLIIFFMIRRMKIDSDGMGKNILLLIIILLPLFLFAAPEKASAETFLLEYDVWSGISSVWAPHDLTIVTSINEVTFDPGELIETVTEITVFACANSVNRSEFRTTFPGGYMEEAFSHPKAKIPLFEASDEAPSPGFYFVNYFWKDRAENKVGNTQGQSSLSFDKPISVNDVPGGWISAYSCYIDYGKSSCFSTVAWGSSWFPTSPSVLKESSFISNDLASAGTPVLIDKGTTMFYLRDGDIVVDSNSATASCKSRSQWVSGICQALPDLKSRDLTETSGNIMVGETPSFTADVYNATPYWEDEEITDIFEVKYGLSGSYSQFASVTSGPIQGLGSGFGSEIDVVSGGYTIPPLAKGEEMYVQHCVDSENVVSEMDDSNNCSEENLGIVLGGPEGDIFATSCSIDDGNSSCDSTVSWTSANFIGDVKISRGATVIDFPAATPDSISSPITPDDRIFKLEDDGGGADRFTDYFTATAFCAGGAASVWTEGSCYPLPTVTLSADSEIIRQGKTIELTVTVDADFDLSCTLVGALKATFFHIGSAVAQQYVYPSDVISSSQITRVECVSPVPALSAVRGGDSVRTEVVPGVIEI